MEQKERLQLLLAYGFSSLMFGFLIVMLLTFINFPFQPGGLVAFITTIVVFTLSFYCASRLVSKYLDFTSADATFILKLTFWVGLFMIIADIAVGGTKIVTLLSNMSFLAAFFICTELFLKPATEMVSIREAFMKSHTYAMLLSIVRVLQVVPRHVLTRWRSIKARYQTAAESAS